MNVDLNPLLPAPYDLMWSGLILLQLVLVVVAFWQIIRSARVATSTKPVWLLLVLLVPLLGPIAWFSASAVERGRDVHGPTR